MQKIFPFLFIIMLMHLSLHAQQLKPKLQAHPVADSVTIKICSCIMAGKDKLTTMEQLFEKVDSCLKNVSAPKIDALLKEDGFIETDDRKTRAAAIRTLGQKLGQRVMKECDGFTLIVNDLKENKAQLH